MNVSLVCEIVWMTWKGVAASLVECEGMLEVSDIWGRSMRESIMRKSKVPITAMEQNYSSSFSMSNLCDCTFQHWHFIAKPYKSKSTGATILYIRLRLGLVHLAIRIRHRRYN